MSGILVVSFAQVGVSRLSLTISVAAPGPQQKVSTPKIAFRPLRPGDGSPCQFKRHRINLFQ